MKSVSTDLICVMSFVCANMNFLAEIRFISMLDIIFSVDGYSELPCSSYISESCLD